MSPGACLQLETPTPESNPLPRGRRSCWAGKTGPDKPLPAGQTPFEALTYQYLPNLPNALIMFLWRVPLYRNL